MDKLFNVEYYRIVKVKTSNEHVWANTEAEARVFGEKHKGKVADVEVRVSHVFAAATTEDKPTPPGLDTYQIEQGKKL